MSNASHPPTSALQAACDWLTGFIASGATSVRRIKSEGKAAGHAWRTCQRAKQILQIKAAKSGKAWVWCLPRSIQQQEQHVAPVEPRVPHPATSPSPSPAALPPAGPALWQIAMVRNDYASPSAPVAIAVPLWAVMGRR